MAKNVNHVSLIKSTNTAITSGDSVFIASGQTGPKLPTPDVLIQGEIAVNLAKGVETLSIKNTDNEIVTFSSDKIIKKVIVDNERITAAALNDLEVNKQDVLTAGQGIDITNNVISATLDVTVDDALDSGSTNPVANSAITSEFDEIKNIIDENELIIASALNDLEERKLDASAYTPTDLSGYYTKQEIDNNKLGSGFTGNNSGVTVTQAINETEEVVAAALNDLNDRIDSLDGDIDSLESAIQNIDLPTIDGDSDLWSSGSTGVPATSALSEVLEEIEEVTATALNDLNDKIAEVSGNQLTADSFKTINNESIIGTGNIEIQGGGGSDANALSGVSVNGTAASVSNKVANITSVPASIVATSSTRNFVNTNEKNSWNTVTAKTDTTAFTQHTGDTTAHVTSAEKSTWNGKQDALSCGELKGSMNRNDVSGSGNISVRNTSGEFPTVISEGTYKVVTYMSSTTQSYGLNVNFGGNTYSLTTSNGVIKDEREIIITSEKTWSASVSGTVASNTVLIVKLYLISSNVSVLGLVAVSNDYDDLYNKPTIPTSLSDINSAHTHSEYALNTAFTAHTASTTAHVTSAEKSTWNGKQDALSNANVLSGISSTNVTNWDNAATSAHSHSNKSVLDNLTQAVITNSHTHSNKSVLDGIAATNLLPAVTAADNGKILMVSGGTWVLVSPTTIYTGTGTPNQNQGNDGDIYLQTS